MEPNYTLVSRRVRRAAWPSTAVSPAAPLSSEFVRPGTARRQLGITRARRLIAPRDTGECDAASEHLVRFDGRGRGHKRIFGRCQRVGLLLRGIDRKIAGLAGLAGLDVPSFCGLCKLSKLTGAIFSVSEAIFGDLRTAFGERRPVFSDPCGVSVPWNLAVGFAIL